MSKVVSFPTVEPTGITAGELPALGFYTPAVAARLARVPRSRLRAWSSEGVIAPGLQAVDLDGRSELGYSFEELVYLRLLRMLRESGISLAKAVGAMKHLRDRFGPPGPAWQDARLFAQGGDLFVERRDDWGLTVATQAGQRAAVVLFDREFRELRGRADALLIPAQFRTSVEIDPALRSGLPVVRGTTLQTSTVYGLYRREQSYDRVRQAYPVLTPTQIKRAVAFERFLDDDAA